MLYYILLLSFIVSLTNADPSQYVVVSVNKTNTGRVPKFGFNLEATQVATNANNSVLYDWMSSYFKLSILRYPGGSISDFWNWEIGGVNQTLCEMKIPPHGYCTMDISYTPDYFADILGHFYGSIGMWDLNCQTSSLKDQLNMLLYAKKLGLDISHVELGNEYYIATPLEIQVYPNGTSYSLEMNKWMAGMASLQNATFAIQSSAYYATSRGSYASTWTGEVINATKGAASAFTVHWYVTGFPACPHGVCHNVSDAAIPSFFNATLQNWELLVQHSILPWPENYEMWITEYNVMDYNHTGHKVGTVMNTWVHALIFAQQTFLLMSSPRTTTVIMAHALGDNIFRSYDNISTSTQQIFAATPFGVVFASIMNCAQQAVSVAPLTFSPQINVSSMYATNGLSGYIFSSTGPEGMCTTILNLSDEAVSAYVMGIIPQPSEYAPCTIFSMDPSSYLKPNITENDLLKTNCANSVYTTQGIFMPPYSFLTISCLVQ